MYFKSRIILFPIFLDFKWASRCRLLISVMPIYSGSGRAGGMKKDREAYKIYFAGSRDKWKAATGAFRLFLFIFSGQRGPELMTLQEFFTQQPKVALGFSGGVDSAYLLCEGVRLGAKIQPYFIKTAFQPDFELEDARRLCHQLGVRLIILELDILKERNVRENPENRCYHCKSALFGALRDSAVRDGYPVLIDGTNASDDAGDRPGMRALKELSVRSPLRECGLTKSEIRRLSREAGLFTWDKPAYACLATRVPSGQELTADLLSRVERAEDFLFSLGLSDFRVRVFYGGARLQICEEQWEKAANSREAIQRSLGKYFDPVMLDFQSRRKGE